MILDQFWLTDAQFSKIAPHLPTDTRGKARVDDRRVISGIVHVLKSGGRWIDAPPEYGPKKTLYNRYVRWRPGRLDRLVSRARSSRRPPAEVLIDSSAVKAHRSASAAKGGEKSGHRSITRRTHDQNPRADRRELSPHRLHAHGGNVADCVAGAELLARLPPCEILHGDKVTTATRSGGKSRATARCRTSRPRPTENGRTAFRRSSTAIATPSNACSAD